MEKNKVIQFMAPTVKAGFNEETKEFLISGEAIHAITTRNGHTFTVEELQKSAGTLSNKPLLKDHVNSVDSIVGRVKVTSWNQATNSVDFTAIVNDKNMQEKISRGDVMNVSVGARVAGVEEVESEGKYNYLLKGVEFLELSLVAVPADPSAGFSLATAVMASFNIQEEQQKQPVIITTSTEGTGAISVLEEQKIEEAQSMENDKNEMILSAISKLTDALTNLNDKVTAMEQKTVAEKVEPVVAAAPESKGVVAQAETQSKSTDAFEIKSNGLRGEISLSAYDSSKFKNLSRSVETRVE